MDMRVLTGRAACISQSSAQPRPQRGTLRGPGRKYGTPISGCSQQLVSRIGVPDYAPSSATRSQPTPSPVATQQFITSSTSCTTPKHRSVPQSLQLPHCPSAGKALSGRAEVRRKMVVVACVCGCGCVDLTRAWVVRDLLGGGGALSCRRACARERACAKASPASGCQCLLPFLASGCQCRRVRG